MMQQLQPSATITRNKFLKTKNSFGRTHAAVKKGVMAVIVFKCIFGSHAYFDFDNADGGLLKGCSSLALYDSHIVPLVSFSAISSMLLTIAVVPFLLPRTCSTATLEIGSRTYSKGPMKMEPTVMMVHFMSLPIMLPVVMLMKLVAIFTGTSG